MKLHDTIDVLIGGYMSKDAEEEDYDAVLKCGAQLREWRSSPGPARRPVGRGDRSHGSRGGRGLGAAGLAIGLAAPPLLATTAIGAALGAGAGSCFITRQPTRSGSRRVRRSRSGAPA